MELIYIAVAAAGGGVLLLVVVVMLLTLCRSRGRARAAKQTKQEEEGNTDDVEAMPSSPLPTAKAATPALKKTPSALDSLGGSDPLFRVNVSNPLYNQADGGNTRDTTPVPSPENFGFAEEDR